MNTHPIQNIQDFRIKKEKKEKITVLTCYDYSFAKILGYTSLDIILIGDSLSSVIQGRENTLSVTVQDMIYHAKAVRRALPDTFIIVDMPFLSYQVSSKLAIKNAGKIIKRANVQAVKMEGGIEIVPTIQRLLDAKIPVMGHIGLEPQSILQIGKYSLRGKDPKEKEDLIKNANALEKAGCFALVLEMIPKELAKTITEQLTIPTIGIGSGKHTDGQVLVLQDMLGFNNEHSPKFLKKYANLHETIEKSVEEYCNDVRKEKFPTDKESF